MIDVYDFQESLRSYFYLLFRGFLTGPLDRELRYFTFSTKVKKSEFPCSHPIGNILNSIRVNKPRKRVPSEANHSQTIGLELVLLLKVSTIVVQLRISMNYRIHCCIYCTFKKKKILEFIILLYARIIFL